MAAYKKLAIKDKKKGWFWWHLFVESVLVIRRLFTFYRRSCQISGLAGYLEKN